VSIVDLIFNLGNEAEEYVQRVPEARDE